MLPSGERDPSSTKRSALAIESAALANARLRQLVYHLRIRLARVSLFSVHHHWLVTTRYVFVILVGRGEDRPRRDVDSSDDRLTDATVCSRLINFVRYCVSVRVCGIYQDCVLLFSRNCSHWSAMRDAQEVQQTRCRSSLSSSTDSPSVVAVLLQTNPKLPILTNRGLQTESSNVSTFAIPSAAMAVSTTSSLSSLMSIAYTGASSTNRAPRRVKIRCHSRHRPMTYPIRNRAVQSTARHLARAASTTHDRVDGCFGSGPSNQASLPDPKQTWSRGVIQMAGTKPRPQGAQKVRPHGRTGGTSRAGIRAVSCVSVLCNRRPPADDRLDIPPCRNA